jgi:plastocyanin
MHRAPISLAALSLGLLLGCGSSDSKPDAATTHDAAKAVDAAPAVDATPLDAAIDAAPQTVFTVACAGVTPNATVTTTDGINAYMPAAVTIPVNGIIQFKTSSFHDVNSSASGFGVGFSAVACLKFTAAGAFPFSCSIHGFSGLVTVQ